MTALPDTSSALIPVPPRIPWYLRPGLWLARRMTGKNPLPGQLLAWFPKAALGAGIFEALTPGGGDLDLRVLTVARIVASRVAGCPFCLDLNASHWKVNGLTDDELRLLVQDGADLTPLGPRLSLAAAYARALSVTPVEVTPELVAGLKAQLSSRELVVLATTIAQVNYWARFNQGLGVPSAGFFDESVCKLPG